MVSAETGIAEFFVPGEKRADGTGIDLATTKNVKWAARLGTQTYGNPTVSGGRVFVGTNDSGLDDPRYKAVKGGAVKCLDEATGRLLWQLVIPPLVTADKKMHFDNMDLGVCSSPTVEGDRVYAVSNRCEVLCLDADGMADGNDGPFVEEGQYTVGAGKPPVAVGPADGDIIWRFDMFGQLPVQPHDASCCSVLVHGDLVYVCTANGMEIGGGRVPLPLAPSLIVLDKRTGRLVAQDDEKIGTRLFHGQWSSPSLGTVGGRTLIFFGAGDGVLYAFEPATPLANACVALKKAFSFDCNPPEYKFRDGKPIDYRTGDVRRKLGNADDGKFTGPSEIIATPVFYKNRVYVAIGRDPRHGRGRGMLTCIDATQTGDVTRTAKVWSYGGMERSLSTVSIADGLVYVADYAGQLHCLDAETGQCYWVHQTKANIWGSTLVADGKVYLGTEKSFWVLAAGRELKVLHEIRLGAPSWCTPIVANGVLYVASQRYLWAVSK